MTFNEKRKLIEDKVLNVIKILDNKKMENYANYKIMFANMSDDKFKEWVEPMGKELDATIQLTMLPFEEMKMTQIKKACDYLKIPMEEYIYYRQDDPQGVRSKMKVPVGYVSIKRMQQMIAKKNRYATDNEDTDLKSGQVTGLSKVASMSSPETYALTAIGADNALKELLGPRADNQKEKAEMYSQINRDGYCTLEDVELADDSSQSTTLNTINTYFLASGIRSNLITDSLKTKYTIKKDLEKK